MDDLSEVEKADKPLLGLPVSIKENIMLKGYESTIGCANRIGVKSERHAVLVQVRDVYGQKVIRCYHMCQVLVPKDLIVTQTPLSVIGSVTLYNFHSHSSGWNACLVVCSV